MSTEHQYSSDCDEFLAAPNDLLVPQDEILEFRRWMNGICSGSSQSAITSPTDIYHSKPCKEIENFKKWLDISPPLRVAKSVEAKMASVPSPVQTLKVVPSCLILVRDGFGLDVLFHVTRAISMSTVMNLFSRSREIGEYIFYYNSRLVSANDTPETLGMEEKNMILAYFLFPAPK